jgi:DNA polymerase I-like protein with 3'-5' exonuclease and polymerase domains/5'-3' exonuclease
MILLDAKAVMYHCYHIGTDPEAINTALDNDINTAAYGFNQFMTRYMLPILEYHAPIDILIAHDGGTDYRTALLPDYKQTKARLDRDPEEREQNVLMMDMMKRFWGAIGCTQAKVDGVEADDLLAYFCQTMPGKHMIYTVDADLLQLANEDVQVYLKMELQTEGTWHDVPYAFTSLSKSMVGDTSDKYAGVKGFGPAKWTALVESYGYDGLLELEECVKNSDYSVIEEVLADEPNKVLQMLSDHRHDWRKSYLLAILHPELCWKPKGKKLTNIHWFKRLPDVATVQRIFDAMGCSDLIDHEDVERHLPVSYAITAEDVDEDLYTEFRSECAKSPIVSFDYETYPSEDAMLHGPKGEDYVDVKEALIAGASFTFGENLQQTMYLPVQHNSEGNVDKEVIGKLLRIAEEVSTLSVQNAFFEIAVTKQNLGFWLGPVIDTAIMSSYVEEEELAGLKSSSKRLLGHDQASYKDTVTDPVTGEMRTMDQLSLDEVFKYGCDDATCTAHIWVLRNIIMQIEGSHAFFMENEVYTQHALVDAYLVGCEMDWDVLETLRQKDVATISDGMARLRTILEVHCSKVDKERAKPLLAAELDVVKAKAKAAARKKLDKEGVALDSEAASKAVTEAMGSAAANFAKQCLDASQYVPYEEVCEPVEFVPTLKKFESVVKNLGFSTPFTSVARKAITQWLTEVCQFSAEDEHDARPALTKDQDKFTTLLAEAVEQLKSREGVEYDALAKFCSGQLVSEGKVVHIGDELSVGSYKQMQQLMYCKLGLPVRLQTFPEKGGFRDINKLSGNPSTDALAIQTALAEDMLDDPSDFWRKQILETVLLVKEATTRISFYHTPYPAWAHPTDGRIHPQIKNCGTVTRRPSATAPNILAVSKHQEEGIMRSVYKAYADDEMIVSIDFSQQELVITASESGDANLISCYVGDNRRDVHSMTASGIAGVSYVDYMEAYKDKEHADHDKFLKVRKRPAKRTNFLMTYLGEAPTLSRQLIIPLTEAEAMMNAAYSTYPRIQPWQQEVIAFAKANGYTQTAYGNRRHIGPTIFSDKNSERRRMERQGVNSIIQGTAADILKVVLTQCWKKHLWADTGATLLGPVYDEITASVPISKIPEYIDRLVAIMTLTPPNHVAPMTADVSLGKNWNDQIEIGVEPSREDIDQAIVDALAKWEAKKAA